MAEGVVICFSSGTAGELTSSTGTPSFSTTKIPDTKKCKYSLYLDHAGDGVSITGAQYGQYNVVSFKILFESVSPAARTKFFNSFSSSPIELGLNTSNKIDVMQNSVVASSGKTIIEANKWYQIVLYYRAYITESTAYYFWLDGELESSGSQYTNGTVMSFDYLTNGVPFYIAEVVNIQETTDWLTSVNKFGYDCWEFMHGNGSTTSGTALNSGTWANTAEQPASTTNNAQYTASSASGYFVTDGSAKYGPKNNIDIITDTIAWTGWSYAKRGTGSATTHNILMGNDIDGNTSFSVTLTTTDTWFKHNTNTTTYMPKFSEYAQLGMSVSGAQDFILNEFYLNIAVLRPGPIFYPLFKRRNYSVRI